MTVDLNLPAFGLDCREWLVATEAEGLLDEQPDGAPVVAVLSTAVIVGNELVSARAVLSLALLENDDPHEFAGQHEFGGQQEFAGQDDISSQLDILGAAEHATAHDAIDAGTQDICVLDAQWSDGYARFAVPAPGGELAVVAEFSSAPDPSPELIDRFYDLVTSFRWAA